MRTRFPSPPDPAPSPGRTSRGATRPLAAPPRASAPRAAAPARADRAAGFVVDAVTLVMALAAVTFVTGVSACKKQGPPPPPPRPALGVVSVHDVTPPGDAPVALDLPRLERDLRGRLLASGLFAGEAADGGAAAVVRARAEVA